MIKEVAFRVEHSASYNIDKLDISLSKQDIKNIQKAQTILRNNKFISNVRINVNGEVIYLDDENNQDEEWRVDVEQFIVYTGSFYYYAQSKWDSGDYLESEELLLTDFK